MKKNSVKNVLQLLGANDIIRSGYDSRIDSDGVVRPHILDLDHSRFRRFGDFPITVLPAAASEVYETLYGAPTPGRDRSNEQNICR